MLTFLPRYSAVSLFLAMFFLPVEAADGREEDDDDDGRG